MNRSISCVELRGWADAVPLLVRVSGQTWSAEPLQCELRPSQEAVITDVRSVRIKTARSHAVASLLHLMIFVLLCSHHRCLLNCHSQSPHA